MPIRLLALASILLLASCKVERTPREFIDRPGPGGERAELLERQLEERFAELARALSAGDVEGGARALHPALDVRVVGEGEGGVALVEALRRLPGEVGVPALEAWGAIPEPNPRHLWFAARLPAGGAFSGHYEREGVDWLLTQIHLTPPPEE